MNSENNMEVIDTYKRPKWVWAITIWFVFSFLHVIFSLFVINVAWKVTLSNTDMVIILTSSLLAITAAITLFMRKKITIKLWGTVFLFAFFSHLYSIFFISNYLMVLDKSTLFIIYFKMATMVIIHFYTKRLNAHGYFQ